MPKKQDLKVGSLQPLLDVSQNQLNLIFNQAESLDTKHMAIMAANFAALLFAMQTVEGGLRLLEAFIFGAYTVSAFLNAVGGVIPFGYLGASVDIDEYPEYLSMAEDDLLLQLIADTKHAINHNQPLNRTKLRLWVFSITLTSVGTAALIWSIIKV